MVVVHVSRLSQSVQHGVERMCVLEAQYLKVNDLRTQPLRLQSSGHIRIARSNDMHRLYLLQPFT